MSLLLFLGGTTNKSTWRDELIPLLDYENLAYFNPVVDDWNDEALEREMFIKSLPTTVELYVITKEMKGTYSIAEAVESSNKKPDKTIFLFIPDGFDQDQIKSLNAVQKIIEDNGAHVANNLTEIGYIFKDICLGYNRDKIESRLANRRASVNLDKIFNSLEIALKTGKKELSYQEIMDTLGISEILENMFIEVSEMSEEYLKIIYNSLKKFLKYPLYRNLDLKNKDDLRFLRDSGPFKGFLKRLFDDIKSKLVSRQYRVEKFLEKNKDEKEVSVEDIIKDTKTDKISLMFILSELKENKKIYDYNGRTVFVL